MKACNELNCCVFISHDNIQHKTDSEVVHQPVPGKPYGEPTITVNEQIKIDSLDPCRATKIVKRMKTDQTVLFSNY